MLRARVIPCLLVRDNGLVKTRGFADDKYVGDPINAVRIFNEKEADELMVLDIDATVQGREPNYKMIEHLAAECRMPLCYGGGVKSADQARRIMGLGVEKVALSSAIVTMPQLVSEIAGQVGRQSVVAVLDVKKRKLRGGYRIHVRNGKEDTNRCPIEFSRELEQLGIGEIVVNSIDNDGAMKGYDLALAEQIRAATHVPLTLLGGAGSLDHFSAVIAKFGVIGVAAGSFFVFKGPYRAVLISYPSRAERDRLQPSVSNHLR
jgi:imidazole glycerol-phosphate synthase subunit HisF